MNFRISECQNFCAHIKKLKKFKYQKVKFYLFRIVFWDVLLCKIIVDNHFTRQYIPEDNSEPHTRRRENLKSHKILHVFHISVKSPQWRNGYSACHWMKGSRV
jgi:hypothetical protein